MKLIGWIALIAATLSAALSSEEPSFFHHEKMFLPTSGKTSGEKSDDEQLIKRILTAYRNSEKQDLGNSMWKAFFNSQQQEIHHIFMSGNLETSKQIFQNPSQNTLLMGIDGTNYHYTKALNNPQNAAREALRCLDSLLRLAEALNAVPLCNPEPKVLEIGAGVGRTAFYAHLLGIKNYTIIDIPISAAASSYFLGRTLGESTVLLEGESSPIDSSKVKIYSPNFFFNSSEKYDLILNADSLTEMDPLIARMYADQISLKATNFLSINHKSNSFTVQDCFKNNINVDSIERKPYWMRSGYVEEIYKFKRN